MSVVQTILSFVFGKMLAGVDKKELGVNLLKSP
jgi:hypothetical protein